MNENMRCPKCGTDLEYYGEYIELYQDEHCRMTEYLVRCLAKGCGWSGKALHTVMLRGR